MIFVVIFVIAMLIVPLRIDFEKHGTDNILHRSAADILQMTWVKKLLRAFNVAVDTISPPVVTIVGFALLGFLGYLALKLLGAIIGAIIRWLF